ncbi:MAG TPA: thiamine phosphate synthase [Polyangia bacterium]|nr:thiamine phosphate synthase [Polyangia bacterium]
MRATKADVLASGYYAILDCPGWDGPGEDPVLLARVARLLAAKPCMLQLRAKAARAQSLATLARAVLPLARAAGVPLCVNDRLDVALAVGADAVHLGQDDLPLTDARAVAAGRLIIGVSTHNPQQAADAEAGGADYLGFGPVFGTVTKANPDPTVGVDGLRRVASAARVPIVAIGGVTLENVAGVVAAGARAAAVIAAIENAPDPTAAGRAIATAFVAARAC